MSLRFSKSGSPTGQRQVTVCQATKTRTSPHDPTVTYAVGDVHGELDLYLQLESLIIRDSAAFSGPKRIVLLGDMIDRGPRSADMIDHLLTPPPAGFSRLALLGNHEDMMRHFLHAPAVGHRWLRHGGRETLMSYGLWPGRDFGDDCPPARLRQILAAHIPAEHLRWLASLPSCLCTGGFFLSHTGFDPNKPLANQTKSDLVWGDPCRLDLDTGSLVAVHGHIAAPKAFQTGSRISLDTGAHLSGRLAAARLTPDGVCDFLSVEALVKPHQSRINARWMADETIQNETSEPVKGTQ